MPLLPSHHPSQHLSVALFKHLLVHWLNMLGSAVSVSSPWNFQMYSPGICFSLVRKTCSLTSGDPRMTSSPPTVVRAFIPPKFSLYIAGVVDALVTITLLCLLNLLITTVWTSREQLGRVGLWDGSNTSWGTKNTHSHGSENDLPPDSTSNMQK